MTIPLVEVLVTTAFEVAFAFKYLDVTDSCLVKSPLSTALISCCCRLLNRFATLEVFDGSVTAANCESGISTFIFAETDAAARILIILACKVTAELLLQPA